MRVQVAAKLEDEVEGMAGTRGKEGQALDVGEEFQHGGGKVGSADGVIEIVL